MAEESARSRSPSPKRRRTGTDDATTSASELRALIRETVEELLQEKTPATPPDQPARSKKAGEWDRVAWPGGGTGAARRGRGGGGTEPGTTGRDPGASSSAGRWLRQERGLWGGKYVGRGSSGRSEVQAGSEGPGE